MLVKSYHILLECLIILMFLSKLYMNFIRVGAASAQFSNVSAKREHDLNTNQTSFTAGFMCGPWETVPSRSFAMVTRDSFQRCHATLSSQQLIHSPSPSGSPAFVPFLFRPFNLKSALASWKQNIPRLTAARIMHVGDDSAMHTHKFAVAHTCA